MPGELITVGRNSSDTTEANDTLWVENSNDSYVSFYGTDNATSLDVTFVCNESVYTSKKFDKLIMYLSGNNNESKFTKFTFTDSIGGELINDSSLSKMSNGKHITPIVNSDGSGKSIGNYLIIKAESTSTGLVEVFGALIHNRPAV